MATPSSDDPLAGLDQAVDWHALQHAYGPADDVPPMLRQLASADLEEREAGYDRCYMTICHQGTRYSATAPALRVLVALLAAPATPAKDQLLVLIHMLGAPPPADAYLGRVATWRQMRARYRAPGWEVHEQARRDAYVAAGGRATEEERRTRRRWLSLLGAPAAVRQEILATWDAYAVVLEDGLPAVYGLLQSDPDGDGDGDGDRDRDDRDDRDDRGGDGDRDARVRAYAAYLLATYPDAAEASAAVLLGFVARETRLGPRGTGIVSLGFLQRLAEETAGEDETKAQAETRRPRPPRSPQGAQIRSFLHDLFAETARHDHDDDDDAKDSHQRHLAAFSHWCSALALLRLGSGQDEHVQEARRAVSPATFPGLDLDSFVADDDGDDSLPALAVRCLESQPL